jgi:serine/threonine-protein kinase
MVTGVRPVTGDSSYAVMNAHLYTIPRAPSAVNPNIPEPLSLIILRAVEKAKESRFQSAGEFSESLKIVKSRLMAFETRRPSVTPAAELLATEIAVPPVKTPVALATPTPVSTQFVSTSASGTGQTSQSGSSHVQFDPERLQQLTRELASFVGPMAKVLVNRAAKKAQTWKQLYDVLAPEVPEGAERKRFLSKRP